ncbi:unnamed protein product [Sphenostylis stenocarpa]|uniref:Uncharacterized protein n=1 Tax=Sphenostylis stenocarpa TaxID=92480 RepID=A0AA86RUJ7_9FABA|nr:unnamed protein product [Sphenostylis stenocarpa]
MAQYGVRSRASLCPLLCGMAPHRDCWNRLLLGPDVMGVVRVAFVSSRFPLLLQSLVIDE